MEENDESSKSFFQFNVSFKEYNDVLDVPPETINSFDAFLL